MINEINDPLSIIERGREINSYVQVHRKKVHVPVDCKVILLVSC